MKALDDAVSWAKENRIAAAVILILGALLLLEICPFGASNSILTEKAYGGYSTPSAMPGISYDYEDEYYGESYARSTSSVPQPRDSSDGGAYVEVKTGSMNIETKTADSDSAAIKALAESYGGYVENTQKSETDYYVNFYLTVRLPSDKFETFVEILKDRYDEKSFNLNFYRVSTQRELDEIELIEKTISDYEVLREKANGMELTDEQVDMLFRITEKELELRRLQKSYESSLTSKEKQSEFSTVTVTLQQKKSVKVMPENLGNRLRNKIKYALDDISNTTMDIFTGTVALFFSAVKFAVYGLVVLVVLIFGYRVALSVYKSYFPAKKRK